MRSALSLAAGPRDDGQWTVGEILMSAVPADVVVLAACSSAQGRTFAQEGRVGFVHAFLVAGARHVVATLWDVDDAASSAFSLAFHSALAAGRSPSAAVRSAQRTLREDVRWAHPAHWAGWQVWGPRN